jgi:hypothetical protein
MADHGNNNPGNFANRYVPVASDYYQIMSFSTNSHQ